MRVTTRSRKARSCVIDDRAGPFSSRLFELRDAVDIEMIGGLVEQQQIGLHRERERQRGALAFAAGRFAGAGASRPKRCRNSTKPAPRPRQRRARPAIASKPAAPRQALAQRTCAAATRAPVRRARCAVRRGAEFAVVERARAR